MVFQMSDTRAGTTGKTPLTGEQRNAFAASFIGWTMDAFDYFLVVLVYADIAKDFDVSLTGWRS